jgi:quinone-modifying oxidoreductase subunit QmoC
MSGDAATTTTTRRLTPDRELVAAVLASGGEDLRKCMQCATCSVVCELADARNPGPRKEMLWAQWGLRDRLMGDVDPWLCHQCGDCTLRCPRGARPGDVMAALRRECVIHYATPRAFGRWVNQPRALVWIALGAAVMLAAAAVAWQASGVAAVELAMAGPRTVFPFWTWLPHWLLGTVFGLLLAFDVVVLVCGARRFWRDMNGSAPSPQPSSRVAGRGGGVRGLGASWRAAFRRIVWHEDFGLCAQNQARRTSHLLVVYGMLALWLTSLWVVTARWNPLLEGLVYPLGFWNPWKLMANLAGLSVVLGATLMLVERGERPATAGATRYADGALLGFLLTIVLTGFATEVLHFLRVEPLRYAVYAVHLVSVFAFLWVLPYSKLAHVVYRTLALVHAERIGRGQR